MNEFVQTLWQEFAAESDEHLAVLEPLLVRLGSAEGEAGDVARLFRGFHSLKGLARAMALYGMEAVAHRAENLLGLVRDSGVAMTEPMLDGLLEAVDSLKGLRDAAVESRADATAPPRSCRSSTRCSRRRRQRGRPGRAGAGKCGSLRAQ